MVSSIILSTMEQLTGPPAVGPLRQPPLFDLAGLDLPDGRAASVLRRLAGFAHGRGIPSRVEVLLSAEVIEAFVLSGPGLSVRSQATYRSVLYALARTAGLAGDPRRPTPLRAMPCLAPYAAHERAGLFAMAQAQKTKAKRDSAAALLLCGLGAGLRPGELVLARGSDLSFDAGILQLRVAGPSPRVVPVAEACAKRLWSLAQAAADGFVFCPGAPNRASKNLVGSFCERLRCDPSLPAISSWRCRSSFVCDHLDQRTPLCELVEIAGIENIDSLARYCWHVRGAECSKAALRRRAAEEERRC